VKQVLRITTLLASISLTIAGVTSAQAQDSDMYISFKGAKAFSLRSTFDPTGGVPTDSYDLDFKNEWAASSSIGQRLNEYLRIEAELGYLVNTIDKMSSDTVTISGSGGGNVHSSYIMASVLADLPLTDQITTFVGGGIGATKLGMDKQILSGVNQTREMEIEDQYVFAWKLTGGLSYEMYENTHLFADYTYFQTADFDVKQKSTVSGIPFQNTLETNLSTHMIGLGLRYDF